jgi:hypothetical protein
VIHQNGEWYAFITFTWQETDDRLTVTSIIQLQFPFTFIFGIETFRTEAKRKAYLKSEFSKLGYAVELKELPPIDKAV